MRRGQVGESRGRRVGAAAALAIVCALTGPPAAAQIPVATAGEERPPNVVLVIIDTLRADHLGSYGYTRRPTSPTLDKLAQRGVVFERAYSPSSWTRTAVASLFSSRHPFEHKVLSESKKDRLSGIYITLADWFRRRGYQTGAFYTNPHFKMGLDQGFEHTEYKWNGTADEAYWAAVRWLKTLGPKPFFLMVHNMDPHDNYNHHPEFPFAPVKGPVRHVAPLFGPTAAKEGGGVGASCDNRVNAQYLQPEALDMMRAAYDGEIAFVDKHFGRLLGYLKRAELHEDTIIVVTSDHGEEFLDHGAYWHGCTLYDELVRVPLIVYRPGKPPRRVAEAVSTLDIYPTLVELISEGDSERLGVVGRDLSAALDGGEVPEGPIIAATAFRGPTRYAILEAGYKLIFDTATGARELYDMERDPAELLDLLSVPLAGSTFEPIAARLEASFAEEGGPPLKGAPAEPPKRP